MRHECTNEQNRSTGLVDVDPEIADAIRRERQRETNTLELIASENFVSEAVMEVQGCVMTNKYAEGELKSVRKRVEELCARFPLPNNL